MRNNDVHRLKQWFSAARRPLPWRDNPTPYAVWVSEIMLQQTRAEVVIPYFQRWMHLFPTINALAQAHPDEVLKAWEGLGYYSRARNLHHCAKQIIEKFDGVLPSDAASLASLRGIGPYTVGAIRSFAFGERAAAVDGNVLRVLARYYSIQDSIDAPSTVKALRAKAEDLLPTELPQLVTEGLIELGALVCTKKPQCQRCPLQGGCSAFKDDLQHSLPIRKQRKSTIKLRRLTAAIVGEGSVLLRLVPHDELMAGLWTFPYLDVENHDINDEEYILKCHLQQRFNLNVNAMQALEPISHSFTRYQATLIPFFCSVIQCLPDTHYSWIPLKDIANLSFPAGHRLLAQKIAHTI